MVALYWLLNRLFTYWFIRDVFPTLQQVTDLSGWRNGARANDVPAVTKDDNL